MTEHVLELLALVAKMKPGSLAAIAGGVSDVEGLERARAALLRLDLHAPEAPRPRPELAPDDAAALRRILRRGELSHEERAALRNALGLRLPEDPP